MGEGSLDILVVGDDIACDVCRRRCRKGGERGGMSYVRSVASMARLFGFLASVQQVKKISAATGQTLSFGSKSAV